MSGASIAQAARAWIGTPYVHQMSVKGAGCDCLGLVRGVWRDLHGAEPETPPAYSQDWSEAEGDERLWRAARQHLEPVGIDEMRPGLVLLFRMRDRSVAKHLGIVTAPDPEPRFVHAYSGHGVIENSLSQAWRRRVVAAFTFP